MIELAIDFGVFALGFICGMTLAVFLVEFIETTIYGEHDRK